MRRRFLPVPLGGGCQRIRDGAQFTSALRRAVWLFVAARRRRALAHSRLQESRCAGRRLCARGLASLLVIVAGTGYRETPGKTRPRVWCRWLHWLLCSLRRHALRGGVPLLLCRRPSPGSAVEWINRACWHTTGAAGLRIAGTVCLDPEARCCRNCPSAGYRAVSSPD